MAKLASKSLNAAPTYFHKWLGELQKQGTLLRVYTQNVDGLEMKTGLDTYPNLQAGSISPPTSSVRCVSLHGSLLRLRCMLCSTTFFTETYIDVLRQGVFPHCNSCNRACEKRKLEGKRPLVVPVVRPDIVLYGETFHPAAEKITMIANQDINTVDLLLVVGTSLRIPGTKDIVHNFSKRLREKAAEGGNNMRSIFINTEKFGDPARLEKYFDAWVEGDCQQFALMVGETKEGAPEGTSVAENGAKDYALARQDSRPLWRYY